MEPSPETTVTSVGRFRYHGQGGDLFGMIVVNALLTIVTLGIYSFWARNRVREFHYSHTELDGDRFAYHGTGRELLLGAILASLVIFGISFVFGAVTAVTGGEAASPGTQLAIVFGLYAAIVPLILFAVNSSRRYRLSRSSWRGVRFSYHAQAGAFMGMCIRGFLMSVLSLGMYIPFFQNERRAFLVNHARFGSEPFIYTGDGRALFFPFLKALLLTIPTLGFVWIWYSAESHRYFWNNTTMRGARFRSTVDGWSLLKLQLTNMLLVFCTIGIGTPWAIARRHAFFCETLTLEGTVDWARIRQHMGGAAVAGEGIAEEFDVDVGI